MTLQEFFKNNPSQISGLIESLANGSLKISESVRNAATLSLTGALEEVNVQGEIVQKLDDFSNKVMMDACFNDKSVAGYLSEENEGITTIHESGSYVVAVDPLDGSSNIDVAAPIGTIFAIWKRKSGSGQILESDFLQKGDDCVGAGFMLYGSSTLLLFSTGETVRLFSFNTVSGAYELVKEDLPLPKSGKIYSINQGNLAKFEEATSKFVSYCTESDKETSRPYSLRYIGSMVGDMYRTFIKGGVFLYPAAKGEKKGKLRLLYECIPMSYLAEKAGGAGIDGASRILEIQPTALHERCAIIIGSSELVNKYQQIHNS
jgi:fructose-1,6-bisphosphatase I